jgi:hypothetical protein
LAFATTGVTLKNISPSSQHSGDEYRLDEVCSFKHTAADIGAVVLTKVQRRTLRNVPGKSCCVLG